MTKAAVAQVSFAVDPVEVCRELLLTEKPKASIEKLTGSPIEACDNYHTDVVQQPGYHSLIAAAHLAYSYHFPLVLTPDVVWLTIAQGLANHVNNHAEELRSRLVPHQGKKELVVRRDDFVKGSPENPWAEVVAAFSAQIKNQVGPRSHAVIVSDFSTTGPAERTASEVVLMNCLQCYYGFRGETMCGIPQVTLEGTVADWEKIHRRVECLEHYSLKWWTDDLRKITIEFVAAAKGRPNQGFWQALYKQKDGSGGPFVQGWLLRLLPYLKQMEYGKDGRPFKKTTLKNPMLGQAVFVSDKKWGITDQQLPSSVAHVPVVWTYLGQEVRYQFLAGLLGLTQDKETWALRPRIGWAVRQA